MTIRVADFIADALSKNGIGDVFMVTGGGSMHLNDAIGRNKHLQVTCCHHEQACAIAAEAYFRVSNRVAVVNVTSGPGATNAITGIYGAFVDSMAVIVLSGQVKWETLVRSTDLPLRQLGDQEVDIIRMVENITKYAVVVSDPLTVRYHLERAVHLAITGRPGPVWLDIPINVQSALIDPDKMRTYDPIEDNAVFETQDLASAVDLVVEKLAESQRPVIYAGTGIRLSGHYESFLAIAKQLAIPIVTAWNSNDLLPDDHPAYAGRPGSLGNRAGNFAVQNADFLLVLGCRLNIRLVSYNWASFAPNAFKVLVDVDASELKKPTLKPDLPIHANLSVFLPLLFSRIVDWSKRHGEWMAWCKERLRLYPVLLPEYALLTGSINPYVFIDRLFDQLWDNEIIVCADGTACVVAFQAAKIRPGQRLFHNSGSAPMGYDLPAAIGVSVAKSKAGRIICLAGDGSIMMNLQELQTIKGNRYPIKIFILNNKGYHSIRQTQNNFFPDNIVGCGQDSGLSFPQFRRIAEAFELPYFHCNEHSELQNVLKNVLGSDGPVICEIELDLNQSFAPKLSSRKLDDGTMTTSPLEDMAPFLSREELAVNMAISRPRRAT